MPSAVGSDMMASNRRAAATAGLLVAGVHEEHVDVRGVVELATAELAHGDDRHGHGRLGQGQGGGQAGVGQAGQLTTHGVEVGEAEQVTHRGAGQLGPLPPSQLTGVEGSSGQVGGRVTLGRNPASSRSGSSISG